MLIKDLSVIFHTYSYSPSVSLGERRRSVPQGSVDALKEYSVPVATTLFGPRARWNKSSFIGAFSFAALTRLRLSGEQRLPVARIAQA